MSYEQETKKLMAELLTSEDVIHEQENKTRSVVEQVCARKRGNAGNHPQYSHEDRLSAISKLITGE